MGPNSRSQALQSSFRCSVFVSQVIAHSIEDAARPLTKGKARRRGRVGRFTIYGLLAPATFDDLQRSVELERENRFRFNADVSLGHCLGCCATAGADARADRRTLAAADQRADDAADCRAAAHEFGGTLVLAKARASLLFEIDCA